MGPWMFGVAEKFVLPPTPQVRTNSCHVPIGIPAHGYKPSFNP